MGDCGESELIVANRGIMRTYSRQGHRVACAVPAATTYFDDEEDLQPRKRVRMDVTGSIIEDEVFVSSKPAKVDNKKISSDEVLVSSKPTRDDNRKIPSDEVLVSSKSTKDDNRKIPSDEVQASSSTVPSSPPRSDRALFSDDTRYDDLGSMSPLSSPPESPPPPPELPSSALLVRKPAFAFVKRKRISGSDVPCGPLCEPLAEVAHNIIKARRGRKKVPLTQMQIDLGGEVRRKCKMCGMEFIPSNKEDAALHEEFCAIGRQGVDIGQALIKDKGITRLQTAEGSRRSKEFVAIVDRRSSGGARKQARRVLEIVNSELSASEIKDEELWGVIHSAPAEPQSRKSTKRGCKTGEPEAPGDRFKIFMYLADAKCAGFCLAEKISTAHRVESGDSREQNSVPLAKSSSISISAEADIALIGISRIWTSRMFRKKGIATMLLDCVRSNFFYGMEVPKDLVAFSQPTESGGRLAVRWFGATDGWHVYTGGEL